MEFIINFVQEKDYDKAVILYIPHLKRDRGMLEIASLASLTRNDGRNTVISPLKSLPRHAGG
jgi:hypothetical protein